MGNDVSPLIVAVLVVLALALVLRWVFTPSRPRGAGSHLAAGDSGRTGLLTVVADRLPRQEALRQRARLQEVGIRSSMSRRRDGRFDVLVFDADADTARRTLDA